MLTLALETSGMRGSVALTRAGVILQQIALPAHQRSAQSLITALNQLTTSALSGDNRPELIAVTQGPGSFTGLRVGLMTAKTLAYTWGCPVVGIDTLHVIAQQVASSTTRPAGERIWIALDAQRQQLFAACFQITNQQTHFLHESQLLDRATWLEQLQSGDIVAGKGIVPLQAQIPSGVAMAAPELWEPQAATVGLLGEEQFRTAAAPASWQELCPNYLRPSAAEENPKFHRPA